jgi:hypothetical protein
MKYLVALAIGLFTFLAGWTFQPSQAEAFVCARGVSRAGCVGPSGAAVVRRPAYYRPAYYRGGYAYRGYRRW